MDGIQCKWIQKTKLLFLLSPPASLSLKKKDKLKRISSFFHSLSLQKPEIREEYSEKEGNRNVCLFWQKRKTTTLEFRQSLRNALKQNPPNAPASFLLSLINYFYSLKLPIYLPLFLTFYYSLFHANLHVDPSSSILLTHYCIHPHLPYQTN